MTECKNVIEHYSSPGLLQRITGALKASDVSIDDVSISDLSAMDEFHFRGAAATHELIDIVDAQENMTILDAGSGLGGPARLLADKCGCHVVGVDISRDYCDVGETLTKWVGLEDRVILERGDVLALDHFEKDSFDGAWSLHVGMNIEDKERFYQGIYRVVKPGATFLIYDVVMSIEGSDVCYPMPWAESSVSSYLLTSEGLQQEIKRSGFSIVNKLDRTAESLAFVEKFVADVKQSGGAPRAGLNIVLGPIFKKIVPNMLENLQKGKIKVVVFVCKKPINKRGRS